MKKSWLPLKMGVYGFVVLCMKKNILYVQHELQLRTMIYV